MLLCCQPHSMAGAPGESRTTHLGTRVLRPEWQWAPGCRGAGAGRKFALFCVWCAWRWQWRAASANYRRLSVPSRAGLRLSCHSPSLKFAARTCSRSLAAKLVAGAKPPHSGRVCSEASWRVLSLPARTRTADCAWACGCQSRIRSIFSLAQTPRGGGSSKSPVLLAHRACAHTAGGCACGLAAGRGILCTNVGNT